LVFTRKHLEIKRFAQEDLLSTEDMDYNIQVTRRVRELVASGVITIGVHITQDGIDTWARCVQPHPRLGIQTHTSYSLEEIEGLLTQVVTQSFRPSSFGSLPNYGEPSTGGVPATGIGGAIHYEGNLPVPKDLGFKGRSDALAHASKKLSVTRKADGTVNQLPAGSLVPADFERSVRDLYARACAVAEKVTTAKLVSRIASLPTKLRVRGAETISEWWDLAIPEQRFMLLTRASHFSKGGVPVRVHGTWLGKIQSTPCPFRDPETQVVQHEEGLSGEEEAQAYSSADELPREISGVTLEAY